MLNSIKNTLKDFFQFLKRPIDEQDIVQTKSHKAKRLFSLLIIDIPLMGLLSILINYFNKLGWVKVENHQLTLLLELLPVWIVVVLTVILIPFIEEIIFRLFLKYKRNYLLKLFSATFYKEDDSRYKILNFWNKKYFLFFYTSAILFALIHIANYDSQTTNIFLFPILILPQFILALFIGYLRVRYNFMLGFLMHALHNAFFIIVALLSINPSTPKADINTNEYSLKIEEVLRAKNPSISYAEDSIQFIGTEMKTVLSFLTKTDEDLLEGDKNLLNKKITLIFKKKSNFNINKDSIFLNHLSQIYNYNLSVKQRNQKVLTLYVEDTLRLENHYSIANLEISNTTISEKELILENATLEHLARELSSSYGIRFENQYPFEQKLNFKLPNKNISKLKTVLNNNYGINIIETERTVEYLNITKNK